MKAILNNINLKIFTFDLIYQGFQKTFETFDGRKMKGHPRFSEKEKIKKKNKDASTLHISSVNIRYSTCHSSKQLFIKDQPANNATLYFRFPIS